MGKLVLWGQPGSINVQKVLWALDELKLPYQRVDIGGKFGKTREAEYLALNPNGLIPTLVDDGQALWESNAIVRYLFAAHGEAPAQPASALVRARGDAWHEWTSSTLGPPIRNLFTQLVRTPEEQRDHALIATSQKAAQSALALVDRELRQRSYLLGDTFTFADIPLGAALYRYFGLSLASSDLPALEAYFQRLSQRPGFQRWIGYKAA
ncbi:MAG: glutathione S-transferase family protein [Myxococcales bacterium]